MYVYGAYRYATRPLEPSNEKFDQWLKDRDPVSGVRDFERSTRWPNATAWYCTRIAPCTATTGRSGG